MKICCKCKQSKELTCFHKNRTSKDGLQTVCKECSSIVTKEYRNTEAGQLNHRKNQNKYHKTEKGKITNKKYVSSEKGKLTTRKNAQTDRAKQAKREYNQTIKAKQYEYDYNHSVARKKVCQKYRQSGKHKIVSKKYRQNNPGKINSNKAKYRADKLQATPKWLTKEQHNQIKQIYINASKLNKEQNESFHVDHIIPLRGKNVSGLHVPWNLQILKAIDNINKSNKI